MEMLFAAKWNVPTAAKNCNLTNKEMKITFNEYCRLHPPIYVVESDNQLNLFWVFYELKKWKYMVLILEKTEDKELFFMKMEKEQLFLIQNIF